MNIAELQQEINLNFEECMYPKPYSDHDGFSGFGLAVDKVDGEDVYKKDTPWDHYRDEIYGDNEEEMLKEAMKRFNERVKPEHVKIFWRATPELYTHQDFSGETQKQLYLRYSLGYEK